MSAYDDAVAYLDSEVYPRCDYDIYRDVRDIVDEIETENKKLRALVRFMWWAMVKASWDGEQPSLTDIRERIDDVDVEVD